MIIHVRVRREERREAERLLSPAAACRAAGAGRVAVPAGRCSGVAQWVPLPGPSALRTPVGCCPGAA